MERESNANLHIPFQNKTILLLLFCMGSFLIFFFSCSILLPFISSAPLLTGYIRPNFTASHLDFVDNSGAFLQSANGTFKASFSKTKPENSQFYFSIIHSPSNAIIWTANRNSSVSDSSKLTLTVNGLTLTDADGGLIWSTPKLGSSVSALQLQDSGNLVLLDGQNVSLWESFNSPTDTLVVGQRLPVGTSLNGAVSKDDLSVGDYRLVVTSADAVLQWKEMNYWKLSMYKSAFKDSNSAVSFLSMNMTGLYLFASNGSTSTVVIQVIFGASDSHFRIAKLDSNGRFSVNKFVSNIWVEELSIPDDNCRIPFFCKRIGLCSNRACSCPSGFHTQSINGDCVPLNTSLSLPDACSNTSKLNASITYLKLGNTVDYFANKFVQSVKHGISLLDCQDLCSPNCSCLGIFHEASSGSCYPIENHLGSFISTSTTNQGFIKAIVGQSSDGNIIKGEKSDFPIAALVLLPTSGFFLLIIIIVMGFVWWRRSRKRSTPKVVKLGSRNSSAEELDLICIPGLPVRFNYEELATATDNFKTEIGRGGFGAVYKGTLRDQTVVAVKKITSSGVQGKREFCTEIAIIGNIHHFNLVNLKGFCAQGRQRFLVYEYMSRGSLDRALFGNASVLEWRERFEIALGTARGLAYLHSGCEHKIIHCDVKPENILLNHNLQVKISDFGLSKLLSPQQSSLFTTLRGTRGYLAPEWLTNSPITDKADVYSYGMVLLEIVRGRKNCSLQTHQNTKKDSSEGGQSLPSSALESWSVYFPLLALEMHEQRKYMELADPRLEGQVTREEVEKLVRVALCCVQEEPILRPSMSNVVSMLEGGMPLGEPKIDSLHFLRFYGQRFTEPSTIGNSNQQNEFILYSDANGASATSALYNSSSYISSKDVSGPR